MPNFVITDIKQRSNRGTPNWRHKFKWFGRQAFLIGCLFEVWGNISKKCSFISSTAHFPDIYLPIREGLYVEEWNKNPLMLLVILSGEVLFNLSRFTEYSITFPACRPKFFWTYKSQMTLAAGYLSWRHTWHVSNCWATNKSASQLSTCPNSLYRSTGQASYTLGRQEMHGIWYSDTAWENSCSVIS